VIPAVVGSVTGLLAAYFKSLLDYRHEISADLWEKRFEGYTEVWKLTEILPKWPKSSNVTNKSLLEFSSFYKNGISTPEVFCCPGKVGRPMEVFRMH